jgi:hypothetical protein
LAAGLEERISSNLVNKGCPAVGSFKAVLVTVPFSKLSCR